MSSLLEQRYRRVLLLPADYRQAWEEDMVASFLQAAYAADPDDPEGVEISRPSRAEVASIAALALQRAWVGPGPLRAPPVRARPWLIALAAGVAATFAVLLAAQPVPGREMLVPPGLA